MSQNRIFITEWAFDSYLDLVGNGVIISDPRNPKFNYQELRDDALLLKNYRRPGESPKFRNDKFWERLKGVSSDLYEMKWHNFPPTRAQLRLHVYVKGGNILLLRGYAKNDANKQKREIIKSEFHAGLIDQGNFKFRGELK